jgi:hypothetical protein
MSNWQWFCRNKLRNRTFTSRWNHLFSQKIFSNLSLIYSKYDYKLDFSSTESNDYIWKYDMDDAGFKYDLGFLISSRFELKSGFQWSFHTMHPGKVSSTEIFRALYPSAKKSGEGAAYVRQSKRSRKDVMRYGLRWSLFANRGSIRFMYTRPVWRSRRQNLWTAPILTAKDPNRALGCVYDQRFIVIKSKLRRPAQYYQSRPTPPRNAVD